MQLIVFQQKSSLDVGFNMLCYKGAILGVVHEVKYGVLHSCVLIENNSS